MESVFEYLINPSLLTTKLASLSEAEAFQHIEHLLAALQSEKQAVGPLEDAEIQAAPPTFSHKFRKRATIQLLILQLASKLNWNISKWNSNLSINLQHQLLDCIISACQVLLLITLQKNQAN